MKPRVHKVEQHRCGFGGIEAMTLVSNHHFPRHSHDQFGLGMMAFGTHRSWSCVGRVEACAGDLIMANPGEMHDGLPVDGKVRGWRIVYFDPVVVRREIEEEFAGGIELVHPVARDPRLAQGFLELFRSLTTSRPDRLANEERLIRVLVAVLRRHSARRPSCNRSASPSVTKARRRLDAAVGEPVSLAELAALVGVSRFQLLRGFVREVGTTPHAYLMQRRVCLAKQFLTAGETPSHAAIAAGFADQSHMTRAFVRYLGVTPGRYQAAVA
jgi:AraC-like DNA-binding protein